jgi:hypothetical protein
MNKTGFVVMNPIQMFFGGWCPDGKAHWVPLLDTAIKFDNEDAANKVIHDLNESTGLGGFGAVEVGL